MSEPIYFHKSLVPFSDGTVEKDFELLNHYQTFTAELLRLSLVGMGVSAYIATKLVLTDTHSPVLVVEPGIGIWLWVSVALLSVSVGAALAHRYLSADGLSDLVQYLRGHAYTVHRHSLSESGVKSESPPGTLQAHKPPQADELSERLASFRNKFSVSKWLVVASSAAFFGGFLALVPATALSLQAISSTAGSASQVVPAVSHVISFPDCAMKDKFVVTDTTADGLSSNSPARNEDSATSAP